MGRPVGPIVKGQAVKEECVWTRRRIMEKLDIDDQKGKRSKSLLICTACIMKGSSVLFTERICVGFPFVIGSRD
jgi:hypothetical protein